MRFLPLLLDSLLFEQASIDLPLLPVATRSGAEEMQLHLEETCPDFSFDLEIRKGRWWLVISRKGVARMTAP